MKKMSTYDKLYEKYWSSGLVKSGTRYERLTAFVLKSLHNQNTVIHDIKLLGESDVKHQIDVTIQENSSQKRILIECKDFDVSGKKVGLGIVRDFWGVVDDIYPDEAIIVTCNGFTREAKKYAKSKKIKLATLREFKKSDLEERIQKVCINLHIMHITEPRVSMYLNEQDNEKLIADMKKAGLNDHGITKDAPVFLNLPEERIRFTEYIERETNQYPREKAGPVQQKINLEGSTIEVKNLGEIPILGIIAEFEIIHDNEYFEVTSNKIAKLILSNLSDADLFIYEEDLIKLNINENTGEIIEK